VLKLRELETIPPGKVETSPPTNEVAVLEPEMTLLAGARGREAAVEVMVIPMAAWTKRALLEL